MTEAKILIYCGVNYGISFKALVDKFDYCFGFEASPNLIPHLKNTFKNHSNVEIIHGALTTHDGEVDFNIFNIEAANSIGPIVNQESPLTNMCHPKETVKVPAINLNTFCNERNINHITHYISDLQGMDFEVLETLKPLLEKQSIKTISIETEMEDKRIYPGLPSNFIERYKDLLIDLDYELKRIEWPGDKHGKGNWKWWADCTWQIKEQSTDTNIEKGLDDLARIEGKVK